MPVNVRVEIECVELLERGNEEDDDEEEDWEDRGGGGCVSKHLHLFG